MKNFILIAVLFISVSAWAQANETFDLIHFTAPAGWKKNEANQNVVSYSITDNAKGAYCQIGIYKSTTSKGSIKADFDSEWKGIIADFYKPTSKPELVPVASENGWDAQGGIAPFTFNGAQSVATLITMSGYNRCASIVILTNTENFQPQIDQFLESVSMKKMDTNLNKVVSQPTTTSTSSTPVISAKSSGYKFNTINFDDGWTSTEQENWVQVTKGNITVLIHYPNETTDAYNSVLMDGLKNAWNILVAPKYSSASNFEFKPIQSWQSVAFAEADAVERVSGKSVHVVLFKMHYSTGNGRYMEFITPDKKSFEQEFGPYHDTSYGWEKMENMLNYNRFAVAAEDLKGKWTNNFSGMTQYVNAYTGADAGATAHSSVQNFIFNDGSHYNWDISVASGMVGAQKFQGAKSSGIFTMNGNWQIKFSDMEGKPKTYDVYFSCIKGARILCLSDTSYPGYTNYVRVP
jgi:hypothetical protein